MQIIIALLRRCCFFLPSLYVLLFPLLAILLHWLDFPIWCWIEVIKANALALFPTLGGSSLHYWVWFQLLFRSASVRVSVCVWWLSSHWFDDHRSFLGKRLGIKCRMNGDSERDFSFVSDVLIFQENTSNQSTCLSLVRLKSNFYFKKLRQLAEKGEKDYW